MKNKLLLILAALAAAPLALHAQFVDTFGSLDPAWVANRYDPAGFASVVFAGDNRLRLTIDEADSAAQRPAPYGSAFYNIQGRERDAGIAGAWTLSADVFVASAFNTTTGQLVRSALWGHTGTTDAGGDYLIIEFTNASPTDPMNAAAADRAFRFRVFDSNFGDYVDLGLPAGFVFDAWHTLSGTSSGGTFDFFIDGALVHSQASAAGDDLFSGMVQGYNFGEAGNYSVYWDNVAASAIPEPGAAAVMAACVALGSAGWRRLRRGRAAPTGNT